METFLQDARYGSRTLWKGRGFTAAAIMVLALGIGSNTAIFGVVNAVLLRPLPFEGQERLVVVWKRDATADNPFVELSVPEVADWRGQNGVFESLAAMPTTVYGYGYATEGQTPDDARRNPVPNFEVVTPRYFRAMGIPLVRGGDFSEGDTEQSPGVVICM